MSCECWAKVGQEITEMNYYIPRTGNGQYRGMAVERAWRLAMLVSPGLSTLPGVSWVLGNA